MQNNPQTAVGPVPITIITGFLGSGKTTLINFLLEEVGGKEKLAIIKNEIGDIAVDSKTIVGKNIVMKELLNGCVCCTLVGELEDSLKELVETVHPDRIIMETSGAANPAILAVNIDRLDFVKRDLIVTVIDAINFEGYKDKSVVVSLQQKFTDLIVLNRVGEVDEERIEKVLDDVYEIRPGIPVVKTSNGRVDPDILFGVLSEKQRLNVADLAREGDLHNHHMNEDEIQYFSYKKAGYFDRKCFEKVLQNLSEEYYRVKGFALFDGKDDVWLVNFVCNRTDISLLKNAKIHEISIIFIGKRVGRYKENICKKLDACLTI